MQNVIISDTDSVYISLGPILDHMRSQGIDINESNKNEIILKLATQIQNESNANLDNISKKLFNITPGTHYFQLKQEVEEHSNGRKDGHNNHKHNNHASMQIGKYNVVMILLVILFHQKLLHNIVPHHAVKLHIIF